MRRRLFPVLFGGGSQTLAQRIASWQSSNLVHIGGIPSASFTGTGGGGAAAAFTLLMPAYGTFQNSIIRSVTVNAVAVTGATPWKLKIFKYVGGATGFQFLRESTFMPPATGTQTVALDTPLACAPGDVLAIYCPTGNNVYWRTGTRSLKVGYVSGDVTTDNTFFTRSGTVSAIELDVLGYKPYLALLGDSIMEGSGNGTQLWYGLYDTSHPAYILTTPGGAATSDPGSVVRSTFETGTELQYQNLALGSTAWQRSATTGAALCAAVKPYKTMVLCGTNDVPTLTWAQVETYMDTTLSVLTAGGSKMVLCEILPRNTYDDTQAATIRTWNTNYATWCAANNVTLIPCHDAMGQVRGSTGEIDDLATAYNKDGIHLTTAGVAALAAILKTYL